MRDEHRHRLLRVGRRQRRGRDRAGARARGARPSGAPDQQRAAVPVAGRRARPVVRPRRGAAVSAVPRAAVPARAGEHDRAGRERAPARHRARPLRRAARDGGVSGRPDARHVARVGAGRAPRTVTTLHGTDITLVGSDPSYARVVAFSIERSHGVTAVSREPEGATRSRALGIQHEIRVIPNFLDCTEYRRRDDPELRARLCPPERCDALIVHVSNFRPVKRVDVALEVFRLIRRRVRARFVLDRRRSGADRHRAARRRLRADRRRLVRRRAARAGAVALDRRPVPAAVGAGELRPRGARSDGVRECRWSRRTSAGCPRSSRTA